jgi:hypothetical protein
VKIRGDDVSSKGDGQFVVEAAQFLAYPPAGRRWIPTGTAGRFNIISSTPAGPAFIPGSYTFTAKNNGGSPHALAISSPGAHASTPTLTAGGSASFTVTLQRTYELWCPVDSHKSPGMDTTSRSADDDRYQSFEAGRSWRSP